MLATLNVKNFAIIDNIQIDFSDGFTVLTGETGAGKSLIIDAISLLFGERASNDLIRYGESKAIIEGYFSNYDQNIITLLKDYDIEFDLNEFLIIKRELYANGKSICKINNQTVSLSQLKEISLYIGDIHSQLETFGLINPKNYLKFIDSTKISELVMLYNNSLLEYKQLKKEYDELINTNNDNLKKQDFINFQLQELKQANLNVNEEKDLKNELSFLNNYENISSILFDLNTEYLSDDLLNKLYEAYSCLEKLSSIDKTYLELKNRMQEIYYNIDDLAKDKKLSLNNFDFDQNRLEEINERLGLYSDLKRKYKLSTEELLEYYESLKQTVYDLENFDEKIATLNNLVNNAYQNTMNIGLSIHKEREVVAKEMMEEIVPHLQDLQLNNTVFQIDIINNNTFLKDGLDTVEFMISFNKGEPLKPLSKVASGGELSRFMLALKTVLGSKLSMQTKIFDEIDSGVSGNIAFSIGKKLQSIASTSQVLCITHLPQVACLAHQHLKISKETIDGRTFTKITTLENEGRIYEIASMISNGIPTEASLNYAKELLSTITIF